MSSIVDNAFIKHEMDPLFVKVKNEPEETDYLWKEPDEVLQSSSSYIKQEFNPVKEEPNILVTESVIIKQEPEKDVGSNDECDVISAETVKQLSHKCETCSALFCSSKEVEEHILSDHANTQPGEQVQTAEELDSRKHENRPICKVCGKTYSSKEYLRIHMRIHNNKLFKCDLCTASFMTNYFLQNHQNSHLGIKLFICEVCNKQFSKRSRLNVHKRTHTGIKPYNCTVCSKSFYTSDLLKSHAGIHTNFKSYCCVVCEKIFRTKDEVKEHYAREHSEIPLIVPNDTKSNEESGVKNILDPWKVIAPPERIFMCKICSKTFARRSYLTIHENIHKEKKYSCTFCDKKFHKNCNLKVHLDAHKRIKTGIKPFSCDLCEKSFSNKYNLKMHILSHNGIKPYSCNKCKASFTSKSCLSVHVRTHTQERIYTCDRCERMFTNRRSLTFHSRKHAKQ